MNKRQIIERIMHLNHSAAPEFLAQFEEHDLVAYLKQLCLIELKRRRTHAAQPVRAAG